jgi:hypothetical protein
MKNKKTWMLLIASAMLMSLNSCADSVSPDQIASMKPVGFLHGLFHGAILPFAWVVSLFSDSTAIYATYNNGGWYDWGFLTGITCTLGGSINKSNN